LQLSPRVSHTQHHGWAQPRRIRKVGVVTTERHLYEAVTDGLREMGWNPEQDVVVVRGGMTGSLEEIDEILKEEPEVLVLGGAVRVARAAERAPYTGVAYGADARIPLTVRNASQLSSGAGCWTPVTRSAGPNRARAVDQPSK
jgi:hypothetical protein